MAARKTKGTKDVPWPDETRQRIRASMLVNRLMSHAVNGSPMESTQIRAAEILLKKVMPDLANIELSGNEDKPIKQIVEYEWKSSESV